jgi:uncharacterized protein (DUF1330 family)
MLSRNLFKYFILFMVIFFITGTLTAQSASIKYVYTIDYPMGEKSAFIDWVKSISDILQKPSELISIASYDNYFNESPRRVVEFEFENNLDAAKYFDDPEIRKVVDQTVDRGIPDDILIINKRSDYNSADNKRGKIKYVHSLDYGVGNRAKYLDHVKSIVKTLQIPKEVIRITSYDNYFNASPNRIIEFEFDSIEDAIKYFAMPQINEVIENSVNMSLNHRLSVLELRGDYKKN